MPYYPKSCSCITTKIRIKDNKFNVVRDFWEDKRLGVSGTFLSLWHSLTVADSNLQSFDVFDQNLVSLWNFGYFSGFIKRIKSILHWKQGHKVRCIAKYKTDLCISVHPVYIEQATRMGKTKVTSDLTMRYYSITLTFLFFLSFVYKNFFFPSLYGRSRTASKSLHSVPPPPELVPWTISLHPKPTIALSLPMIQPWL